MFLKNKNIIFKIRRSKVTDYAALIKNITLNDRNKLLDGNKIYSEWKEVWILIRVDPD